MAKETAEPIEVEESIPMEDIEVSLEDIQETEKKPEETEEQSETETEEVESTETEEETKEETEEASTEETEEESKEEEEAQPSDEERKQHNKEMAEKRIQEKRQKEADVKRQQQEYVADAEDETALALRQLQVEAYNTKVERNEGTLKNSYEKALNDFPILREDSPEIQTELDQALDTFQALNVTIDQWGNPSDVRGDLYSFLQTKANSIEKLTAIGVKKQEGNKAKEKSKALTPPSKTPKEPKKDSDMEAFMEEAYGKK